MDRERYSPKIDNPNGKNRLINKKNILAGNVHVYWFPEQQQEDTDDPTYQNPPDGPFPPDLWLLRHPKVVRLFSDTMSNVSGGGGGSSTTVTSGCRFPNLEGETTEQDVIDHPEWITTLVITAVSTIVGTTYTATWSGEVSGGSGGPTLADVNAAFSADVAATIPDISGGTSVSRCPGTNDSSVTTTTSPQTTNNPWSLSIPNLHLNG